MSCVPSDLRCLTTNINRWPLGFPVAGGNHGKARAEARPSSTLAQGHDPPFGASTFFDNGWKGAPRMILDLRCLKGLFLQHQNPQPHSGISLSSSWQPGYCHLAFLSKDRIQLKRAAGFRHANTAENKDETTLPFEMPAPY